MIAIQYYINKTMLQRHQNLLKTQYYGIVKQKEKRDDINAINRRH